MEQYETSSGIVVAPRAGELSHPALGLEDVRSRAVAQLKHCGINTIENREKLYSVHLHALMIGFFLCHSSPESTTANEIFNALSYSFSGIKKSAVKKILRKIHITAKTAQANFDMLYEFTCFCRTLPGISDKGVAIALNDLGDALEHLNFNEVRGNLYQGTHLACELNTANRAKFLAFLQQAAIYLVHPDNDSHNTGLQGRFMTKWVQYLTHRSLLTQEIFDIFCQHGHKICTKEVYTAYEHWQRIKNLFSLDFNAVSSVVERNILIEQYSFVEGIYQQCNLDENLTTFTSFIKNCCETANTPEEVTANLIKATWTQLLKFADKDDYFPRSKQAIQTADSVCSNRLVRIKDTDAQFSPLDLTEQNYYFFQKNFFVLAHPKVLRAMFWEQGRLIPYLFLQNNYDQLIGVSTPNDDQAIQDTVAFIKSLGVKLLSSTNRSGFFASIDSSSASQEGNQSLRSISNG